MPTDLKSDTSTQLPSSAEVRTPAHLITALLHVQIWNLPLLWIFDIRVNKQAVHLRVNVLHGDLETIKTARLSHLDLLSEALHLVLNAKCNEKPCLKTIRGGINTKWPLNLLDFHSQFRHLPQRTPTREKWNIVHRPLGIPSAGGLWRDQPIGGKKREVCIRPPQHKGWFRSYGSGLIPNTTHIPLQLSRKTPQPSYTSARCHGTEWERWRNDVDFP